MARGIHVRSLMFPKRDPTRFNMSMIGGNLSQPQNSLFSVNRIRFQVGQGFVKVGTNGVVG